MRSAKATLKNNLDTTDLIANRNDDVLLKLGFVLRDLTSEEKSEFGFNGVKVVSVINGSKISNANIEPEVIEYLVTPPSKNELIQISLKQGINNYYNRLGTVKWCKNGTIPYRIGVYFNKEVDIPISLKDLSRSLEGYEGVPFRSEQGHSTLVNNFYINLFKDSIPQLYIGHLCSFFKNKIIDIFQSISSESNIIFLQVKNYGDNMLANRPHIVGAITIMFNNMLI